MRILLVHNRYLTKAGEDRVFDSELELLKSCPEIRVASYTTTNKQLDSLPLWQQAVLSLWNFKELRQVKKLIREFSPTLLHVHNTFPYLSPAIFHLAHREKIPLVFTMHNYRLGCISANLFRDNKICTACLSSTARRSFLQRLAQKLMLPALRHSCYRNSRTMSTLVVLINLLHRLLGTWKKGVSLFLVFNEEQRQLLERTLKIPPKNIMKKNNASACQAPRRLSPSFIRSFTASAGPNEGQYLASPTSDFLYVGRLSVEKGLLQLLEFWQTYPALASLRIAGSGELQDSVEEAARTDPRIRFIGKLSTAELQEQFALSKFLIFPSLWFEGMPMIIIEAMAAGLPIIASRIGVAAQLIRHSENGFTYELDDKNSFYTSLDRALGLDLEQYRNFCRANQKLHSNAFSLEKNLINLRNIYSLVTKT